MSFPFSANLLKLNCLITLILVVYSLQFSNAGNNETERLALLDFKVSITNDPLGILKSWNESFHFCEWLGVTCGHRRKVTILRINSSKLTGTLSPFIGNLSFLTELDLRNNSFIGTIPPEIGRLQRLQHLNLSSNSFGGKIPSGLGPFKNLKVLGLARNNLTGAIPSSLGNLTSLTRLSLSYNYLTGSIPEALGRLNKLSYLALNVNMLSGLVPPSIFNLSLLTVLDLGYNQFLEGVLPLHIGTMLPNLTFLSIDTNNFTGPIPASIANCSKLQILQLSNNSLQGQVPCLQNLQRLTWFTLFENNFAVGQHNDLDFVSCLANSTFLTHLDIGANNFQGVFPSIICNISLISVFAVGENRIFGEIPSCIENLAHLQTFDAQSNKLSGVIPLNIGKLQKLVRLYLSSNQLSGQIPSTIGNLTQLVHLSLADNNLTGHIPSALGKCRLLQELDLSQNNLGGKVPPQLFNLSLLSIGLVLSQNPLTGSLPKEVGQLKILVILDISDTRLSGGIPITLGNCIALDVLRMRGNRFQGAIPPKFSALRGLKELDLSGNNLSGDIPHFLVDFLLKILNLSYNNLEGEVPTGGVFNNKYGLSIVGNSRLCGGMRELNLISCNSENGGKRSFSAKRGLLITIVSSVFGVGLMVASASLYAICFRKRKIEYDSGSETFFLNLSYNEILKATNGFSSANLVGSGTFGRVYKAILDDGITIVAIKTFKLLQRDAYKSFMAECQFLRNVRHRNLLKVITVCSSVDYKGNDFKALVYEYMPNGSLGDWLHQNQIGSVEETSAPLRSLNLLHRVDIAVDVAFALEYLHHHSGASIIHCDIKPNNVLLNGEMVAHVGDFGLAKFISNGFTSSQATESSSIGIRGTVGYSPPEYGLGHKQSTQGDVYSFGILLLELFTGKKPTDDRFKEGLSLHGCVKAVWPEGVMEILDHVILEDIVGEEMNSKTNDQTEYLLSTRKSKRMLEVVTSVLGIALSCSVEYPKERMDMRDVVVKLSAIRNKLF